MMTDLKSLVLKNERHQQIGSNPTPGSFMATAGHPADHGGLGRNTTPSSYMSMVGHPTAYDGLGGTPSFSTGPPLPDPRPLASDEMRAMGLNAPPHTHKIKPNRSF